MDAAKACPLWQRSMACLLAALAPACLAATTSHQAPPAASADGAAASPNAPIPPTTPVDGSRSAPASKELTAGQAGPLSLGAWTPALPSCPDDASSAERSFCSAAAQAIRATTEEDSDDASQLLALHNALGVEPQLARLEEVWSSKLANAAARAQLLSKLARPLRLLRRALVDAYVDPRSGLYQGIDAGLCRRALTEVGGLTGNWQDLVVTVEPIGTYPLSTLHRLCLIDRRLLP